MDALYDGGEALTTVESAGAALVAYWIPVFNCGHGEEESARQFDDYAHPVGETFRWIWVRGPTRECAQMAHDSALAKDGLPYRFWQSAPEVFHSTLDDIAEAMQSGGDVPGDMRDASIAFMLSS